MTDIVIQAENLGKKYTIGHQTERAATWPCATSTQRRKDAETQSFPYSPLSILPSPPEEVCALKDVQRHALQNPARGI